MFSRRHFFTAGATYLSDTSVLVLYIWIRGFEFEQAFFVFSCNSNSATKSTKLCEALIGKAPPFSFSSVLSPLRPNENTYAHLCSTPGFLELFGILFFSPLVPFQIVSELSPRLTAIANIWRGVDDIPSCCTKEATDQLGLSWLIENFNQVLASKCSLIKRFI